MTLEVHQFPCLEDNYGFLVRDAATGDTACIDTPDANVILAQLERTGWRLTLILNTHWHRDHTGGNAAVKAQSGALVLGPQEVCGVTAVDRVVADGNTVLLGESRLQVIATPGHTLGHVCYLDPIQEIAFVGDTLFALGCGRLFEGSAEQMWLSLNKLAALPRATKVYCAHEYTLANARFALSVERNPALDARAAEVRATRERGEWTVPTTIGAELLTNPFLRASDARGFAKLRQAKDVFRA
jgi:hydroxyacylglutathione hydrolase